MRLKHYLSCMLILLSFITVNAQEKKELKEGDQAPTFKYLDINGKEVSLSDLEGKYVYIDVWATWCGPCMRQAPILEELAGEGYHIGKVDVDQAPDLAGNYRVMSIPTLILFKNGEEVKRFVGLQTKDTLKALLDAE